MGVAAKELQVPLSSIHGVINKKISQTHGYYFELDNDAETITSGSPAYKKHYSKGICVECGLEFDKHVHNKRFCSKKCTDKYYSKHSPVNCKCTQCGTPLYRKPYYLRNNKNIFCSRECNSKFKKEHQSLKNTKTLVKNEREDTILLLREISTMSNDYSIISKCSKKIQELEVRLK
jgi:hypothetical protein